MVSVECWGCPLVFGFQFAWSANFFCLKIGQGESAFVEFKLFVIFGEHEVVSKGFNVRMKIEQK